MKIDAEINRGYESPSIKHYEYRMYTDEGQNTNPGELRETPTGEPFEGMTENRYTTSSRPSSMLAHNESTSAIAESSRPEQIHIKAERRFNSTSRPNSVMAINDAAPITTESARGDPFNIVAERRFTTSRPNSLLIHNTSFSDYSNSPATDRRSLVGNHVGPTILESNRMGNHVSASPISENHISLLKPSSECSLKSHNERQRLKRLVQKHGRFNISFDSRVSCWIIKYIKDLFTTSVDMPWRYNILMVSAGFLFSWVFFGVIYYGIAYGRGDFDNLHNETWTPCFRNFENWKSALLYSVEAQTTIGFGFRSPTERCGEAIFFLLFQTIWAQFLEAFIIGTFIGKFSRPKMRANTLLFSKNAVICKQDGRLVFLCRIGDIRRKSPIVEGHVRLQLVRHHVTREGSFYPYKIYDMDVGHEVGWDRVFLLWPLLVCHVIDEASPLFHISQDDLDFAEFEIIVVLEGIVEATGTTTQVRTSYLPNEIKWGHEFENIVFESDGTHYIDFERFHMTRPVLNMTSRSAKEEMENLEMMENTELRVPVWQERNQEEKMALARSASMKRKSCEVESRL